MSHERTEQQIRKGHIRAFMQAHASDTHLAALLAECQDGSFMVTDCCHCLLGIVGGGTDDGYLVMSGPGYFAEDALLRMGNDITARCILIPMIRAEMKRRETIRRRRMDSERANASMVLDAVERAFR